MTSTVGQVFLSWQVSRLKPGTDKIPGYAVVGNLWGATATVNAIRVSIYPAISQFNAVTPTKTLTGFCGKSPAWSTLVALLFPRCRIDWQNPLRHHRFTAGPRYREQRHGRPCGLDAIADTAIKRSGPEFRAV